MPKILLIILITILLMPHAFSLRTLPGQPQISLVWNNGTLIVNDNTEEIENVKNLIDQAPESAGIEITNADVYNHFKSLNPRKSKGPDGVSPKVLRICSQQLSPVYTTIFQQCVKQHIPGIWKTAIVVPVPKKRAPKELNDYRPISLTSIPFKTLERIVQDQLCRESATVLDNLQFSYQKKRSVEDATLTYTNLIYEHLEKPSTGSQNPIY